MKVLIAVEDQKYGEAVVDFVIKHHWAEDSEFKIIHVVEPLLVGSYMSIYPSAMLEEITEQNTKYATELVDKMKTRLSAGLSNFHVFTEVFTEIPKYGILEQAKHWQADMILMGSHGRRGVSRFLLGSVAEAVMAHADCSVTIVRIPGIEQGKVEADSASADRETIKAGA